MIQNMFTGANSTATVTQNAYFTGLTSFTVLGINPEKETIEGWKNGKYNLPIDYSIKDMNGINKRPIDIWLKSVDGNVVEPLRYAISTTEVVSSKGNYQFVNSIGDFTYAADDDALRNNTKMDWFTKYPFRKAFVGENDVYSFMKAYMRYRVSEDSNFLKDAEAAGITAQLMFDGDLTGFKSFIDWCNANDNALVALCAVRKTDKLTVEGGAKTYFNQMIVSKPDYMFMTSDGEVSKRAVNKINDDLGKGLVITNALFTVNYQHFKEEECLNVIPSNNSNLFSGTIPGGVTNTAAGGLSAFINS